MIDLVKLFLKAGDGGDGRVSFFRSGKILKGGPNGGRGGDGGNITIEVDENLNTLQHFSGKKIFLAQDGGFGGKFDKTGTNGADINLKVPRGTLIWLIEENGASWFRREKYGLQKKLKRDELVWKKYFLEKEQGSAPPREQDNLIGGDTSADFLSYLHQEIEDKESEFFPASKGKIVKIANLNKKTDKLILVQGGFGGRGNTSFKSSINTTPLEAEYGSFGEQKLVFLESRLLADIGLVGFPNVGKSSLLKKLTRAEPRVANYPFTTLEPNLGVLPLKKGLNLVLADIPGLIDGAHQGKGLGFSFLRHIQNTQFLVFVLSLNESEIFDYSKNNQIKAKDLYKQLEEIKKELSSYKKSLLDKKSLIIINKSDLYSQELKEEIKSSFLEKKEEVLLVSAITGEGLEELKKVLAQNSKQSHLN